MEVLHGRVHLLHLLLLRVGHQAGLDEAVQGGEPFAGGAADHPQTEDGGEVGKPHHVPPHPPSLAVPGHVGHQVHSELVRPGDVAELLPPPEMRQHQDNCAVHVFINVSPGDNQRHIEAQHEGERNPMVEVSKVDTDPLKVLLHRLIIAQAETVEQADAEVEDPEDEEIAQDSLVDASGPDTQQSEEGQSSRGADLVEVSHSHP